MWTTFLDGSELIWKDSVKHLDNVVDITDIDDIDCNAKQIYVHSFCIENAGQSWFSTDIVLLV